MASTTKLFGSRNDRLFESYRKTIDQIQPRLVRKKTMNLHHGKRRVQAPRRCRKTSTHWCGSLAVVREGGKLGRRCGISMSVAQAAMLHNGKISGTHQRR
jgi:hypothetical protein